MRYPVSGTATKEVPPNTSAGATAVTTLLSITSGRVFWLRGLYLKGSATGALIEVYDATAQTTATTQTIRLRIHPAVATGQGCLVRNFSAPGIKFNNSYVIAKGSASGATDYLPGSMAVWGYEE